MNNTTIIQSGTAVPVKKGKTPLLLSDFYSMADVGHPDAIQGVVYMGANRGLNDHLWNTNGEDFGLWAQRHVKGRKPAYFTMGAYDKTAVGRFKGRTATNVVALRGYWIDVDVGSGHVNSGYPTYEAASKAAGKFVKTTGLTPSCIVLTGSGGLHLHFFLSEWVTRDVWKPRAVALAALAKKYELHIDTEVTVDAARIMRAPGSIHQDYGKAVDVFVKRTEPYTLDEFDGLVGYVPGVEDHLPAMQGRATGINADVLGDFPKFSYIQAAKQCSAMAQAAQRNGEGVARPVWMAAIHTAALSIEGREYAHEISCGHEEYGEEDTNKRMDGLTGGPENCTTWADAYGAGGPCDSCVHRGKIKNPAMQLGRVVDTAPIGALALLEPEKLPDWVVEMNREYALVRRGSTMSVIDFKSPTVLANGVSYGLGYLEISGLRVMLRGQTVPIQDAGEKPRPLADAWLAHPGRRQYEGIAFAPGGDLPANILNMWQGFAVEPTEGNVRPWLEVLNALVEDEAERSYVLRWLAWKVQNPGGVPDTILIFKGAKGTGKNSLFDPLLAAFGSHGMLADSPGMIAGQFNWHLMSTCFAVLDEAVFTQDPRQADAIKSRVTASTMMFEQKGKDPVQGVNRCAYVMLTNHEHVWQATVDERRAVVIEAGEALRGKLGFWTEYHGWVKKGGPAALLHFLQKIDLTGFNPREIPKGEALREQIEQTTLRAPAAAWWHQCLSEGTIRWRDTTDRVVMLHEDEDTEVSGASLRLSYEHSAAARGRGAQDWAVVSKRLKTWVGQDRLRKTRPRANGGREWHFILPGLSELRQTFTARTQVRFSD